jgi:predicted acylesterase/phospholipase RssA
MAIKSELTERLDVWHENVVAIRRIPRQEWPLAGDGGPVVVMAASGGGSRAAIYTAYTLERVHRDLPEVGAHLQAISSVSGGSLASAAYVARRYNWGGRFGEWVAALPAGVEPGELVSAVSQDFLLPTVVGALSPFATRGGNIEATWRDGPATLRDRRVGDRHTPGFADEDVDLTLTGLASVWHEASERKDKLPPFPVPLFNTCTLDQHDVVISPLAAELYTKHDGTIPDRLSTAAKLGKEDWLTWVADRDAIYGLDKLLPKYDPSLPKAVRASANFPFGFPLVELDTRRDRNWFSDPKAGSRSDIKLTDGGVLSNSGLWPLFPLLTDATTAGELARRGVLLIVVEASKMPEYTADRRDLTTLYGDLNNRNPVAQALHRRMIEGLRTRLAGAIAVVQIDITPRAGVDSANVMTTWALDPASQQSLKESFRGAWEREQPRIRVAWDCLRRAEGEKRACLEAAAAAEVVQDQVSLRPPLD